MIHWLEHERAKAEAKRKSTHTPAYLHLQFTSVSKPIVVEVAENYFVEFEISDYAIGDDGIGSFEYHGFKGNHSRPFVDIRQVMPISVNGDVPSPELTLELLADFKARRITADCEEVPTE